MKTILLIPALVLMLLSLPSYAEPEHDSGKLQQDAIDQEKQAEEKAPPKKMKRAKKPSDSVVNRGFDPCLLNANLPVCSSK